MRWQPPSLSLALATLNVVLLLTTVTAVLVATLANVSRARDDFEQRLMRINGFAVANILGRFLSPANVLLTEAEDRARRGLLAVDDPDALGAYLVERIRHQPEVDVFLYGEAATGRLVGAWRRDDGAILLMRADPAVNGGQVMDWEEAPDGRKTPYQRGTPIAVDPRERPWYLAGSQQPGIRWTEPYQFFDGQRGISAALALSGGPSGQPRGVFTVNFPLANISAYLGQLAQGRARVSQPLIAAVTRTGQPLAATYDPSDTVTAARLALALAELPAPIGSLPLAQLTRFPITQDGVLYSATAQAERLSESLEGVVVTVVPTDEFYAVLYEARRAAWAVGLSVIAVATLLSILLARRISRPLRLIAADLEAVGRFELSTEPTAGSFVREIAVVATAVDRMKASLRSFGRYVPRQLVQEVLASGEEARLGGQTRTLSLYFSDVAGFTSISESMPPGELVAYLGEYLQEMSELIEAQRGTVDKFIGDGILALFNAPHTVPDHAAAACRAALASQTRLSELRSQWHEQGRQPLRARVGLHTGDVVVGNIGAPERFEYTVTGDAVNLASRLEGLSKVYGTKILASEDLRAAAGPAFEWRTVDRVAVVGRQTGTLVSELLGERGGVAPAVLLARDLYEAGFAAYLHGDFERAGRLFDEAGHARPDDLAARVMSARANELSRTPPPDGWDGVYRATAK